MAWLYSLAHLVTEKCVAQGTGAHPRRWGAGSEVTLWVNIVENDHPLGRQPLGDSCQPDQASPILLCRQNSWLSSDEIFQLFWGQKDSLSAEMLGHEMLRNRMSILFSSFSALKESFHSGRGEAEHLGGRDHA